MELRPYADADFPLTEALETDADVMHELGGPIARTALDGIHCRRLDDPWWLTIVPEPGGPAVGTIGIWEKELGEETIHETGWMVLPAYQRRGIASAALTLLIRRARAEPRFDSIHAFPAAGNAPSNALCRKFGFEHVGELDLAYAGRALRCNHWKLPT